MRWLALLLILYVCSCKPKEDLNSLYDRTRDTFIGGELNKALDEADRGQRLAASQHDLKQQWRFRLLRAEILPFNRRPEEMLVGLADPVPQDPSFGALATRKTMLEGQAHALLKNREKGAELLEQAHRAAEQANDQKLLVEIENLQGPVVGGLRTPADGERILMSALDRAKALQSRFLQASVLINLGFLRLRMSRWEEAASYFERALATAEPRWLLMYPMAQNQLAICYQRMGDYDRAIAIQKEAIAMDERTGVKVYLLGALTSIGDSYLSKGEFGEAIPYLQRALTLAGELGDDRLAAFSAGELCDVYIELHDWLNADALNQAAIRLKQESKIDTTYYNLRYSADIAAGKGELDRAVPLYKQVLATNNADPDVLCDAHKGLGMIAWRRRDLAGAAREFEAAIDLVEKTRSEMQRTEFKLPFLSGGIKLYRAYGDLLLEQGQTERALAIADSSRAQVLAERSGVAPVRRLPPGAYANLARTSGAVLLSYWLAPERSHVWVVTPRDIQHVALPAAGEIERLVTEYQGAIERQLADPLRPRLPAGEKLYQLLIAPVRQYLPPGSRVVLVTDGAMHGLNLEALPVPGEPAHYLIQDLTFEIVPSLSAATSAPAKPSATGLLLLGDPVFNDRTLPPLAAAAREIDAVRRHFAPAEQVVLPRESATPQAFLAAARAPFAAIHFTAHALANREQPLQSAVLLSGGKLYARDVMDLPLKADLVTVSACRGAGERAYSGEGLVGFAWAFLRAGARNVIASLWDVNDQSTAGLMESLYRELAAGKRPVDALRAAKLAMIQAPGNLRKPYYWAPFQLYTVAP
jgi:CHAT domain-containing protein/tetratricopeptide (TPR) repeat protein